jgi:multidrug efflux pump subunit AcrA (membrane-fusion protein)
MADMSTLEVEADVSESNLEKVRIDQPCEIELDALPSMRFAGYVSRTVPTVDRAKATVMTKIRFRELDPRILPDMSAKVAFLSQAMSEEQRTPRPAVNAGAVVSRGGREVVYAVQAGKAVETPVRLGERIGDLVELRQGPKPGEKVVLHPSEKLADGAAVKPARK